MESNFSYFDQVEKLINSGNIVNAGSLNQTIVDTNLIEFNKKFVLSTYLQSFAVGDSSLDSTQISNLELIAWQTLAEGGDGVSMARSMLHLEIDDEFGTQFRTIPTNSREEELNFNCFPNPFSNNVLVSKSHDNSYIYMISLYASNGDLILNENFNTKNHILSLKDLSSGTYVLKINDGNKMLYSKLLVKL